MKLKKALEIARDCGLETVGEAILNIHIHATSLFSLSDLDRELDELKESWCLCKNSKRLPSGAPVNADSKVEQMLRHRIAEENARKPKEQSDREGGNPHGKLPNI